MHDNSTQRADYGREVSVELYVRTLAPDSGNRRRERLLEELATLRDRDRIANYELHLWGLAVVTSGPTTETGPAKFVLDRVAAFREWASTNDRDLEPALTTETVADTQMTPTAGPDTYEVVRLPDTLVAEYEESTLRFVAPSVDDGRVDTVEDRLGVLAGSTASTDDPTAVERIDWSPDSEAARPPETTSTDGRSDDPIRAAGDGGEPPR